MRMEAVAHLTSKLAGPEACSCRTRDRSKIEPRAECLGEMKVFNWRICSILVSDHCQEGIQALHVAARSPLRLLSRTKCSASLGRRALNCSRIHALTLTSAGCRHLQRRW
jgi:hypothetical protein